MGNASSTVYVASVIGGNCVTKVNGNILNKKPTKDPNQLWTIERKDGSNNQIALRCNGDEKYLRAKAGNAYGAVETGAKQWWQLEEGQAPSSFWLKCCDFPDAYLCNANGSYGEGNNIYMWPKQLNWTHALTFYLRDVQANGIQAIGQASDSGESAKRLEEVEAKEAELAKREAELAKNAEKVEGLTARSSALEEREKKLSAQASAMEDKEKKLSAREQDLKTQSDALQKQTKAPGGGASDTKSKDLQKDLDKLKKQQEDLFKTSTALEEREKALAAKEKALSEKSAQATAGGGSSTAAGNSSMSADADQLVEENKRLATELASAKKEIVGLHSSAQGYATVGTGSIPPPRLSRPALKRPEAKRPAANLPGQFDSRLLERFEAGKIAMKST